jgi:exopolysaccharide biosynthesis polyprenyl glycosylphosphotransferase
MRRMSVIGLPSTLSPDELYEAVGARTHEIVSGRRSGERLRRRGWLVRRLLLVADLVGLVAAFVLSQLLVYGSINPRESAVIVALLPIWILMAKIYGLYDRDEEHADHSTVDDVVGVFHLVTVGVWLLLFASWVTGAANPEFVKAAGFWLLAILFITAGRGIARAAARHSVLYVQNLVIVGAGDIGQLAARKVLQHPEYGIHLVGFVDDDPRERRDELSGVSLLGRTDGLPEIVRLFDVDRVVIAFSKDTAPKTVDVIRSLRDFDVQIDVVPRLFDLVGPRISYHSIEALPLIGLRPVRLTRSSRVVKRLIDVVGASFLLALTAPLYAVIAVLIRWDSTGPVLFRQTRLGLGMREFTTLKFRTMRVDVDDSAHRDYIKQTMSSSATVGENGIYKLDRSDSITRVGRWLRRTSLDELPQLLNVLRGDMSLVGPRPCIPYETEHFKPYQFERFLVPAGLTGLWQVTARARSTFGEALDMDVAYARGWSLGLDLRLLWQTPLQMVRQRGTA